jgi:hypothetical protein
LDVVVGKTHVGVVIDLVVAVVDAGAVAVGKAIVWVKTGTVVVVVVTAVVSDVNWALLAKVVVG